MDFSKNYTTISCFSIPCTPNVRLNNSTRSRDPIALFGLSESFTHDTHSLRSGRQTASGLITIDIEPNGPYCSFSFGRVHLVLFESSVPHPFVKVPITPWNLSVTHLIISNVNPSLGRAILVFGSIFHLQRKSTYSGIASRGSFESIRHPVCFFAISSGQFAK